MATPTNLPATAVAGDVLTALYVNNLRGAFRILQVSAASITAGVSTSSSTFADVSGLSVTITPQASTNKILVMGLLGGCYKFTGDISNSLNTRILRGATVIGNSNGGFTGTNSFNFFGGINNIVLDSPATTSATTYKVQIANGTNAASAGISDNSVSTLLVMEVSA